MRVELAEKPNVLVIVIDAGRRDRFGCYGYSRGTTPAVDELARSGLVFERMISTAPRTLPSHWDGERELLTPDYPLIENHVLDSLGLFTMLSFVEEQFGVEVGDEELVLENFGAPSPPSWSANDERPPRGCPHRGTRDEGEDCGYRCSGTTASLRRT